MIYESSSIRRTLWLNLFNPFDFIGNNSTSYSEDSKSNESFNEKSVRLRLARIRELQGQVESMTVKNTELYNWNKEKDKEISDLKNHNFKEGLKTTRD